MKTIILAGSGHAHLEVINALTEPETSLNSFILLSPNRRTYYSGLIPRYIAGDITSEDVLISSADLAEHKGITFIQDSLVRVDLDEKTAFLKSGRELAFDILSLNVGGSPLEIPSDAPEKTIPLRPFDDFASKWEKVERFLSDQPKNHSKYHPNDHPSDHRNAQPAPIFVVVGGGPAAVEVATALQLRLHRSLIHDAKVHLITQSERLCEHYSQRTSRSILDSLKKLHIQIHFKEPITKINVNDIQLSNGQRIQFDFVFLATPTKPSTLISNQADATLRVGPTVFAVGDGATMRNQPDLPRSGVSAVRQGRHLVDSIRRTLCGLPPLNFQIPKRQINILISSASSAHFVWGSLSFESKFALWLKNRIDRRYMNKMNRRRGTL